MKRALHLFLLLGALVGIFGGTAAYSSVAPSSPVSGMATTSIDCVTMASNDEKSGSAPCRGADHACVAAIGCAASVFIFDKRDASKDFVGPMSLGYFPSEVVLHGSNLLPELRPPTTFD